ncbi:MAG: MBL fold metallo-hydrolase, partial [Actinobacteria bacterium]|nr:MBL fold metallo-hydrolase [Actinomycetota bacterium]
LGGAGFVIKDKNNIIGLDLYLSNACENALGECKKLIPSPLRPEEIKLNFLISTHDHGDHLDIGSLHKFINNKTNTKLIGPGSVIKKCKSLDINDTKLIKLDRDEIKEINDFSIKAVFSDHGNAAPDCIGVLIKTNKRNIYFTSDTCYRPDLPKLVNLKDKINVLIVPINGTYGNPDSKDASYITAWVKPQIVIPSHFWQFIEQGGNPGEFLEYCSKISPETKIVILAIGEGMYF